MNISDLKQYPEWLPVIAEWHFKEWAETNPMLQGDKDKLFPCTFVAHEGGTPVGSVSLVHFGDETKKVAGDINPFLVGLYVLPEYRSQGLGKKLTARAELEAKKRHVAILYLVTHGQENFYQTCGWQSMNTMDIEGKPHSLMVKSLA